MTLRKGFLSIRIKLLIVFLWFVVFAFVLVYINRNYFVRKERISELQMDLQEIRLETLQLFNLQEQFFAKEIYNPAFYLQKTSPFLNRVRVLQRRLVVMLNALKDRVDDEKTDVHVDQLEQQLFLLTDQFESMVEMLMVRGFRDYGLEGRMRVYAHTLQEEPVLKKYEAKILSLRRHEKDFIIRGDQKYAVKLRMEAKALQSMVFKDAELPLYKQEDAMRLIQQYTNCFDSLVALESQLGMKDLSGMRGRIIERGDELEARLQKWTDQIKTEGDLQMSELKEIYLWATILLLLTGVLLSYYFARLLSQRVTVLSRHISDFVSQNFRLKGPIKGPIVQDEIGQLYNNFRVMEEEIAVRFKDYREKVERRTEEILEKNEHIRRQISQIERQRDLLYRQKEVVEVQNKSIVDSIRYAKRIQAYLFPRQQKLDKILGEHFVFFQPKDIVSGDFYWAEHFAGWNYAAVVDCTGHGVPGAFMSILGHDLLSQALLEKEKFTPAEILNYMDREIRRKLGQNGNAMEISDGMDLCLVRWKFPENSNEGVMQYASAHRPLVYVHRDELLVMEETKRSIGSSLNTENFEYFQEERFIYKGDTVYLFSDGYADQFGGEKGKKFKQRNFLQLLFSLRHESMQEQYALVKESFDVWRGEEFQVDDVCVMGIRF